MSPFIPCGPISPCSPISPFIPCGPMSPGSPISPFIPCGPDVNVILSNLLFKISTEFIKIKSTSDFEYVEIFRFSILFIESFNILMVLINDCDVVEEVL